MSEQNRIHALVSGRVQGVGFRYFTQRVAQSMNLVGEVRNTRDGRVEIIAEGDPQTLKKFLRRIEEGPSLSHVSAVDVEWMPATGRYDSFEVTF
ncbi:MAG TPA: acylphosphatase [bacterium]|nr:acylphosphatase [Candidatus Omnitrophota bacterium]HOJ62614.1 acylphosphatase [bacterium]HOL94365.1 acylphosphatase [bacterium]HPP00713.1 acylphosphatase [bacterium]HXK93618.1 acylphosphatase [bacterium]